MNGRRIRRGGYGHQRWRTVLMILLLVITLLLLSFFVVGSFWYKKLESESRAEGTSKDALQTTAEPFTIPSLRAVKGYDVDLEGLTTDLYIDRLEELRTLGADAVTLRLTDTKGALLYRSSVGWKTGNVSEQATTISLDSLVTRAEAAELYVSGILSLRSRAEKDELQRAILAAYEVSLICEAVRQGVDEVIILWDGAELDIKELVRMVEDIRAIEPAAVLGFASDVSYYSGENAEERMEQLCRSFDFFCISATCNEDNAFTTDMLQTLLQEQNYHILRYHMRVLIPVCENRDEEAALISVLTENQIFGWQIYHP